MASSRRRAACPQIWVSSSVVSVPSDRLEHMFERGGEGGMTDRVEGDIGVDLDALSDHDLLASMRADVQRANVYHARGLAKMEEFRRRRALDVEARRAVDPHFTLTPVQETVVEVAPLLGLEHGRVRADLRMVRALQVDFPDIWRLCVTGQLDVAKASMVWQAADWNLKHASDLPALAAAITRYLTPDPDSGVPGDPDSGVPGSGLPLVTKTRRQLSGRLSYWLAKFDKKSAEDQFRAGFRQRSVRLDTGHGGMGYLSLNHTCLLYTSPSPRDGLLSRMPSSA